MKTQHQILAMAALAELGQCLQCIEKKQGLLSPARPEWLDAPDVCNLLHISKWNLESYRENGYLKLLTGGEFIALLPTAIGLLCVQDSIFKKWRNGSRSGMLVSIKA